MNCSPAEDAASSNFSSHSTHLYENAKNELGSSSPLTADNLNSSCSLKSLQHFVDISENGKLSEKRTNACLDRKAEDKILAESQVFEFRQYGGLSGLPLSLRPPFDYYGETNIVQPSFIRNKVLSGYNSFDQNDCVLKRIVKPLWSSECGGCYGDTYDSRYAYGHWPSSKLLDNSPLSSSVVSTKEKEKNTWRRFFDAHFFFFVDSKGLVDSFEESDVSKILSSAFTTISGDESISKKNGSKTHSPPDNYLLCGFESLYGPYFEPSVALLRPDAGMADLEANEKIRESLNTERSFSARCEASRMLKNDASGQNNFSLKWRELLALSTVGLPEVARKLSSLDNIAKQFAEHVSPFAQRLVDEFYVPPKRRLFKPLGPGFENVFFLEGNVYVLSLTQARQALYGGPVGAAKAAHNELLAVRVLRNAIHIANLFVPLCTSITYRGVEVFVSASMPLRSFDDVCYGCLPLRSCSGNSEINKLIDPHSDLNKITTSRFIATNFAVYTAYEIGELLNLQAHQMCLSETLLTLPVDMKLVYSVRDGALWALDVARICPSAACRPSCSVASARRDGRLHTDSNSLARHPVEDHAGAHLYTLFRPEFVRKCLSPASLNPDGIFPFQQLTSGHKQTGQAIGVLYLHFIPAAVSELLTAFSVESTVRPQIDTILHANGVNMRYLGEIYTCLDAATAKAPKPVAAAKKAVAVEMACRTFKQILLKRTVDPEKSNKKVGGVELLFPYAQLPLEDHEVVELLRNMVCNCTSHECPFWEQKMKPEMIAKFGKYVNPLISFSEDSATKRQDIPSESRWVELTPGLFHLYTNESHSVKAGTTTGADYMYMLLGPGAIENAALLNRLQEICCFDLALDDTGKDLTVVFKAKTRLCTFLPTFTPCLVPAVEAASAFDFENTISDNDVYLKLKKAVENVIPLVESLAKKDLSHYCSKSLAAHESAALISSDPRVVLTLFILVQALAQGGPQAVPTPLIRRIKDIRKGCAFPELVEHMTSLFIEAPLYAMCGLKDSAITVALGGLTGVTHYAQRTTRVVHAQVSSDEDASNESVELLSNEAVALCSGSFHPVMMVCCLYKFLTLICSDKIEKKRSIASRDQMIKCVLRAQTILEYCYYAAYLAERTHHALLPFILLLTANFKRSWVETFSENSLRVLKEDCRGTERGMARDVAAGSTNMPVTLRDSSLTQKNSLVGVSTLSHSHPLSATSLDDLKLSFVLTAIEETSIGPVPISNLPPCSEIMLPDDRWFSAGISPLETKITESATPPRSIIASRSSIYQSLPPAKKDCLKLPSSILLKGISSPTDFFSLFLSQTTRTQVTTHKSTTTLCMKSVSSLYRRLAHLITQIPCIIPAGCTIIADVYICLGECEPNSLAVQKGVTDLTKLLGATHMRVLEAELSLATVLVREAKLSSDSSKNINNLRRAAIVLQSSLRKAESLCDEDLISHIALLLLRLADTYSHYPALSLEEHELYEQLTDTVISFFGGPHKRLVQLYKGATNYYINLSKANQGDQSSVRTTLIFAARFCSLWVDSLLCAFSNEGISSTSRTPSPQRRRATNDSKPIASIIAPEIATFGFSVIDSLLSLGVSECRSEALSLFQKITETVGKMPPEVKQNYILNSQLAEFEKRFKLQPKHVEKQDRKDYHVDVLKSYWKKIKEHVENITMHRNRQDIYCQLQAKKIKEIGRNVEKIMKKSADDEVQSMAEEIISNIDKLLGEK